MITRRTAVRTTLLGVAALGAATSARSASPGKAAGEAIAALERRHGGRLGVAIRDTATSETVSHRGDERFALCSTFKLLASAFVLARVDRGEEDLARIVPYGKADLVTYSPVTEKHAGSGMPVAALCEAATTLSDNTAANLLLASFGGPAALTRYLRSIGDGMTRLDRIEPALNEAEPGDPRDSTTPVAMLDTLQRLVLGTALSDASRTRLAAWLVGNKTGDARLRAGLPSSWRVGDKTGSGRHNVANDVAIVWPAARAPMLITAYYAESSASASERDAVLAEVGSIASQVEW